MPEKEIGEVQDIPYEMKHVEWKITDFLSIIENKNGIQYRSPTFTFADILWHIKLFVGNDYITMYFGTDKERKPSVKYYFDLKKNKDSSMEHIVSGTLKTEVRCGSYPIPFIKRTELLRRKSELVDCGFLTIICTLKLLAQISNSSEYNLFAPNKSMKLIRLDKLSENFKDLLGDKESCDVTLKAQGREYKAHKSVLMARSSVFAANFKQDTLDRQTVIINIPDCEPDSFQIFLEYLYSGKIEEFTFPSTAIHLYYTSNEYDVTELKEFCVDYLKQSLSVDNICEVAIFADKYDEAQLMSVVNDFFNENAGEISETSEWECLMQKDFRLANKLLKEMLKRRSKE